MDVDHGGVRGLRGVFALSLPTDSKQLIEGKDAVRGFGLQVRLFRYNGVIQLSGLLSKQPRHITA
jgi:hypothetical protein